MTVSRTLFSTQIFEITVNYVCSAMNEFMKISDLFLQEFINVDRSVLGNRILNCYVYNEKKKLIYIFDVFTEGFLRLFKYFSDYKF